MPALQRLGQRLGAARAADLADHGGDVVERVAAAPQQVREFGVADVGGAVAAVAGGAVAFGGEDPGLLPVAQGRRGDAEAARELADGERVAVGRLRPGTGLGGEALDGRPDRVEGAPVAELLLVAAVDDHQGGVDVADSEGVHDLGGRRVAVGAREREEGAERGRVDFGVDPVAAAGAFGGRDAAVALVVADGLGRQAVLAREVGRSHVITH